MSVITVTVYVLILWFLQSQHKKKYGGTAGFWSKQGGGPVMIASVLCQTVQSVFFRLSWGFGLFVGFAGIALMLLSVYRVYKFRPDQANEPLMPEVSAKLASFWEKLNPGTWIVVGWIVMFVGGAMIDNRNPLGPVPFTLGLVAVLLGLGKKASNKLAEMKKQNKERVKAKRQELIDFYNECKKNGILSCTSEKDVQKATLIARRMNLPFTDIRDLYAQAQAQLEEKKRDDNKEALEALRRKERERWEKLNRYANKTGRDKRVAILNDLYQEADKAASTLIHGTAALMAATQESEKSWAISGGIASGLAGPAAGLAAAMDTQAENARIRERNKANWEAHRPLADSILSGSHRYTEQAAAYKEALEEAKIKLVAKDSTQACMDRLTFRHTQVTVSETGTCTVQTQVSLKAPFRIFDDVDAVVDGTVDARIFDGKTCIGTAALVFPTYGVSLTEKLTGTCLFCGKPGKQYTVTFEPRHLWAMEK